MSASRSEPISTAMVANASQRWSATRSVRGVFVFARSSLISCSTSAYPSEDAVTSLSVDQHSQHAGVEQDRVCLQHLVGAGDRGEDQRLRAGRAVRVHG